MKCGIPRALTLSGLFFISVSEARLFAGSADEEFAIAKGLVSRGAFDESVAHWKTADRLFKKEKNAAGECETQIQLASNYYALGQTRLALETLSAAQANAIQRSDRKHLAAIKAGLGAIYVLTPDLVESGAHHDSMVADENMAESSLKEAVKLSKGARDSRIQAEALNNLGNLYSYQSRYAEAGNQYKAAIDLAAGIRDQEIQGDASANLARAAIRAGDYETARTWANRTVEHAAKIKDSHRKAYQLLSTGRTFNEIFARAPEHENRFRLRAFEQFTKAAEVATAIGDKRALSFALGYEGELYEAEKKYDDALPLTRKAALLAQEVGSPDALYRWQWQTGRLLGAKHDSEAAIAAYRRAVETLQSIRHDVALHYGNSTFRSSFRDVAGPMYFQLADLLLQRADSAVNGAQLNAMLVEARDSAEMLKSAELEDYFQDQCVNLFKSKVTKIETISNTAAIVYIIPLPDRTELLVNLPSGLRRVKSAVTDANLTDTAHRLRVNLEKRTTYEYLDQATQIYDWLIRPLEPLLAGSSVDTLVFIPDGGLRNIPMAALYDGERYLVEKYAVAVTPGLTLMEPRQFTKQNIQVVVNGLSESVQGFAPLQYVPREVSSLKKLFGGTALMNGEFVKANVEKEFSQENSYSIVHIASHGHFDSEAKKTFVLTFESRLSLDELERLIRPSQLREKPVELLALSACQTAAGDDRAALGLAGIAIKAGARSAFATLWFVNDQSSASLVSDFYTQLRDRPEISKAKALQAAQVKLMGDQRYAHPCYWAPYLIIGNWL